jgi:hypothetical protein
MPAYTSPDVRNLAVGTGSLYFKPETAGAYYHLGNVPSFQFSMNIRTLDHYAPVNGIKVKDYVWTTEMDAEVDIEMEELTALNFQMLMFGDIVGGNQVNIFARNAVIGALAYRASNEVGPRWNIDLWSVTFNNDGSYAPISSSDFSKISVRGTALAVNGSFGVMQLVDTTGRVLRLAEADLNFTPPQPQQFNKET